MSKSKPNPDEYSEKSIKILEGLTAVRKRPSMYIGDVGHAGLHHLVQEIIDNSVDEALAGHCTAIQVVLHKNGSCTISDNGRGIPVYKMKHENPKINGKPAAEICLTTLHAGGKFDRSIYKVSGGLHGVGVSVVNALSKWLWLEVKRDGKMWQMEFEQGKTTKPMKSKGATNATGTTIQFQPDPKIFKKDRTFSYELLRDRLRELAFLNDGLSISIKDERTGKKDRFKFRDGLKQFVKAVASGSEPIHPVLRLSGREKETGLQMDLALQYTDEYSENTLVFANNIRNMDGGTHLSGLRSALTRTINTYGRTAGIFKDGMNPTGDDIREGLCAVLSVRVPEPQFEAQTKVRLMNPEVGTFVEQTVNRLLSQWLDSNPHDAKKIALKGLRAARAREAARKARELSRKGSQAKDDMPAKLWDCTSRRVREREIFLVEGDSAAGSAKSGRDSKFQAILPLRGKILNVEKARIDKVLSNEALRQMVTAIGCGIGRLDFDLNKRRYDKIIIMTDADVDGSHIRTLILTFLFRHMRPLIEGGHVYVALPPLFEIRKKGGRKSIYLKDESDLNRWAQSEEVDIKESKDYVMKRFKGLGEMNAEQLWDTTMNPENRQLQKVVMCDRTDDESSMEYQMDAREADRMFKVLMGSNAEIRRTYIEENALHVGQLDV